MKKKKIAPAVGWILPGKKRFFAHSTIAESDSIALLADMGHTPQSALQADLLLGPNERAILQGFADAGYRLTTLKELKVGAT